MPPTDILFVAGNALAGVGWLSLFLAPRGRAARLLVHRHAAPLAVAAIYSAIVLWSAATGGRTDGDFFSLAGVDALFDDRWTLLAGWLHYLAFDLFVAGWQSRDAERLGIAHGWTLPALAATLWVGPAGLLLYVVSRRLLTGRWAPDGSTGLTRTPKEPHG